MTQLMPHNTLPQRAVESKNASRIQPLVHGREAPHLPYQPQHVGFTLVGMSLAACAERETAIRLSEAGHSTRCPR
jgi:hypothetical protein